MPSDKDILIDIDSATGTSPLSFQDFPTTANSELPTEVIRPTIPDEATPKHSIWTLEYFQKFFDVDTDIVVNRIIGSIIPKRGVNYLQHYIQSKPDLYGPFWICVTLVFTIAISGNIANYLQAAAHQHSYHWKYDFHAVSASATAIFLYAWLVPIVLWLLLKYQGSEHFQLSLLELMCVYGYSLSVYVPISVLWVIQVNIIQWLLVLIGASLSGFVLMTSVSPAFGEKNFLLLVVFLGLHALLAIGFMWFFFHVPPIDSQAP